MDNPAWAERLKPAGGKPVNVRASVLCMSASQVVNARMHARLRLNLGAWPCGR